MNITKVNADLLEYPLDGLCHSANCFQTFGAGLAKSIKIKYPEAFAADISFGKSGDKSKLGKFSFAKTYDGKIIYNLYGQYSMGTHIRQTSYDALYDALTGVKKHAIENSVRRLGIPYNIGCGLGGGDWAVVSGILASVFGNCPDLDLYICQYEPK